MTTPIKPLAMVAQLRNVALLLRKRPMPLAEFIPLLQRAADTIERLNDPTGALTATQPKGVCVGCGLSEINRMRYANGCPMNYPEIACPYWASWRNEK